MEDERGFFSRLFCSDIFLERGLCANYPQWSVSFNSRRGTLRGLRSRGRWVGVELSADNRSTLYIPAGFAHGFQTLTDDAEVRYHISERYHPEAARGVRWDDPDIGIVWPKVEQRVIASRDQALPRLRDL